jgi:hypothetical protein
VARIAQLLERIVLLRGNHQGVWRSLDDLRIRRHIINQSENAAWSQHAPDFADELFYIDKMMGRYSAADEINRLVGKRQLLGLAYCKRNVGKTALAGKPTGDVQHLSGQIGCDDMGNMGSERKRGMSRTGRDIDRQPIGTWACHLDESSKTCTLGMRSAGGVLGGIGPELALHQSLGFRFHVCRPSFRNHTIDKERPVRRVKLKKRT